VYIDGKKQAEYTSRQNYSHLCDKKQKTCEEIWGALCRIKCVNLSMVGSTLFVGSFLTYHLWNLTPVMVSSSNLGVQYII
jgi:hypothetical protein